MLSIGGITPFTTIDYPGKLAAVLFCQGCPWRCEYCHNKHLLEMKQPVVHSWEDIIYFLEKRRGLLEAVVFSGGEPTMQQGLPDALVFVKGMGFLTGLHTGGAYPDLLIDCLPYLDWVGMDIKAPFELYERITRVSGSAKTAHKSAELLIQSNVPHQFRTTVDPFLLEDGRLQIMIELVQGWGEELILQEIRRI